MNHPGRGATVGDFDNDGGIDVVVVHQNEPVSVLRNRFPHQRFISLDIIGTRVDRDAIGTTVTVRQEGMNESRSSGVVQDTCLISIDAW